MLTLRVPGALGDAPLEVPQVRRMIMPRYSMPVLLLVLAVTVGAARAEEPLSISIAGNVVTADLQVAGGYSAELTVTFEDVVGLSADSLGISATAIDPADPALLSRLGSAVSGVPIGFPVLVRIEPDPDSGLSFSGIVRVELYTHDLEFIADSPLRLYSGPIGGALHDITVMHGSGSYRTGGSKGNFSEFIIATELRTSLTAAGDKLAGLRTLLNDYAADLDTATYDELSGLLIAAESAYAAGDLVSAVTYVEAFADSAKNGGAPSVWGASHDLENIAGRLRAAAGTLRFSLTLAINNL